MMPLAPTSLQMAMPSSKPKIGFSIDSIVGLTKPINNFSSGSESSERPASPFSDCSYPAIEMHNNFAPSSPVRYKSTKVSPTEFRNRIRRYSTASPPPPAESKDSKRLSPENRQESPFRENSFNNSQLNSSLQERLSPANFRKTSRSPSPPVTGKGPLIVPGMPAGLVRPFPHNLNEMTKSIPPYLNSPEMVTTHPNPHFLAAQFQMAAALAHGGQGGDGMPNNGVFPPHPSHFPQHNIPRDGYPLYPWLLSRHGRIFPNRFPGNFLLQPFRKPKRVRTAFSPSQLLKLEHAFEGNHYVVGAERKTLAQNLSLSETQVKVWFQNRRTKHKRMQQEEEAKGGSGGNNHKMPLSPGNSHISYDEDELIDMDDSDEESDSLL